MQYASKEASRRMARPRLADWALLKRLGRYLLGAQLFCLQTLPKSVNVFADSDWAGCQGRACAEDLVRHAGDRGPQQRGS